MCMCTHTHIETGIINLFLDHIVQVPSADLVPMHFSFHDYEINMTYNLYTTITADNTHLEKHLSCNFLSQCCGGGGGGAVHVLPNVYYGLVNQLSFAMTCMLCWIWTDPFASLSLFSLVTQISAALTWPWWLVLNPCDVYNFTSSVHCPQFFWKQVIQSQTEKVATTNSFCFEQTKHWHFIMMRIHLFHFRKTNFEFSSLQIWGLSCQRKNLEDCWLCACFFFYFTLWLKKQMMRAHLCLSLCIGKSDRNCHWPVHGDAVRKNNHHHMKAHLPQLTIIEFFSHLID